MRQSKVCCQQRMLKMVIQEVREAAAEQPVVHVCTRVFT